MIPDAQTNAALTCEVVSAAEFNVPIQHPLRHLIDGAITDPDRHVRAAPARISPGGDCAVCGTGCVTVGGLAGMGGHLAAIHDAEAAAVTRLGAVLGR